MRRYGTAISEGPAQGRYVSVNVYVMARADGRFCGLAFCQEGRKPGCEKPVGFVQVFHPYSDADPLTKRMRREIMKATSDFLLKTGAVEFTDDPNGIGYKMKEDNQE